MTLRGQIAISDNSGESEHWQIIRKLDENALYKTLPGGKHDQSHGPTYGLHVVADVRQDTDASTSTARGIYRRSRDRVLVPVPLFAPRIILSRCRPSDRI